MILGIKRNYFISLAKQKTKNEKSISFLLFIVFNVLRPSIYGQSYERPKKSIYYKTWVTTLDNSSKIRGYMTGVSNDYIVLSDKKEMNKHRISINKIKEIKFRRKGSIGRSILVGTITGFLIGSFIGLSDGDDNAILFSIAAKEKAIILGSTLGLTGAIVGGFIGITRIRIPINGKIINHKEKLLKYKTYF